MCLEIINWISFSLRRGYCLAYARRPWYGAVWITNVMWWWGCDWNEQYEQTTPACLCSPMDVSIVWSVAIKSINSILLTQIKMAVQDMLILCLWWSNLDVFNACVFTHPTVDRWLIDAYMIYYYMYIISYYIYTIWLFNIAMENHHV